MKDAGQKDKLLRDSRVYPTAPWSTENATLSSLEWVASLLAHAIITILSQNNSWAMYLYYISRLTWGESKGYRAPNLNCSTKCSPSYKVPRAPDKCTVHLKEQYPRKNSNQFGIQYSACIAYTWWLTLFISLNILLDHRWDRSCEVHRMTPENTNTLWNVI